jgi:hypothetical protein
MPRLLKAFRKHELTLEKDGVKSYVYVKDNGKEIGLFFWNTKKRKYEFEEKRRR